jgi:GDSL-like Lipase/Acylhydrolase family
VTVRGRLTLLLAALGALLGLASPASGAPALGRWEATRADGRGLTFTVARTAFGTAIRDVTGHCPDRAEGRNGTTSSYEPRSGPPGDRTPTLNPVDARGRIRAVRKPRFFAPLGGRLRRTRGTVRLESSWRDRAPIDSCDLFRGLAFDVRHVDSVPVTSGVWAATGPVLLRPSIIGLPVPVRSVLVFRVSGGGAMIADSGGQLWDQRPARIAREECSIQGDRLLGGRVRPDGSFTLVRDDGLGVRHVLDGRFTSATTVSGVFWTPGCGIGSPISGQLIQADAGNALAPGETEPIVEYAALGDSYASGEGVDPYVSGTERRFSCHRSTRAYSELVRATGVELRRRSFACSGAVTANVGRLGSDGAITGKTQRKSEGAIQLDRLTEADWRHVGLVTITIGGNDARFEPTLAECTFVQCDRGNRAKRIERRVTNTLPSFLALTYAAIARRAPQATVVVVGYPRLFPGPGQAEPRCFANKLPRARQLFLNRVSGQLRDVIARQARRSGFFFLDVAPTFAGHEPCGPKDDWIFGLSRGLDRGVVSVKSYHPNRDGQEGYARALRRFLSCVVTRGAALHADGLPANPGPGRAAPAGCTPN